MWEYKVILVEYVNRTGFFSAHDKNEAQAVCNGLAKQGWELVAATAHLGADRLFFKRDRGAAEKESG
jgi:hypothetical protein